MGLTDVAAQEGYYDSLDADMQYWAQRQVYELLLSDDSLMLQGTAADTLLALWKDSVATGNIGAFRTVADSAIANAAYAAELNYNITPLNHAEENEQAVYALYFALAGEQPDSAQYEALSAIAAENAISGGGGVYMARAMIDTNADDVTGIASLRMIAPKQTDIKHSGKLYPNPANTVVYYENVLGEDENGKIKLMDMLGKEIKEYKLTKGSNLISIPVSELSKGIYMVKVEITERNSEIIKLVVN
ncbi:MAG TPA: T9SS type A sorting domain-containing protein [Bacteroidia bacterium]|nr:T9SS type A sorting domain-containing protein [Bacteroidia bacterium]